MSHYIETGEPYHKAIYLVNECGARVITKTEAKVRVTCGEGVVCVVANLEFEAAAFCDNLDEFARFTDPMDKRVKTWLAIDSSSFNN